MNETPHPSLNYSLFLVAHHNLLQYCVYQVRHLYQLHNFRTRKINCCEVPVHKKIESVKFKEPAPIRRLTREQS